MCGRYYVDDETAREIEKLIRQPGVHTGREKNVLIRQVITEFMTLN